MMAVENFVPSKNENNRWMTRDELRFLDKEMIRERIISVFVRTGVPWCPTPEIVRSWYKLYLKGLEKRRKWDEIDKEVVLNRCLRLIHRPPLVEVLDPPETGSAKSMPIVRVLHD